MGALIGVLPGDGVGPEVTEVAVAVLQQVGELFCHDFDIKFGGIGGHAIDLEGDPFPSTTRDLIARADGVLLGAVGGTKWSDPSAPVRPEQGLLDLRQSMGVFANIRPVRIYPELVGQSPLRPELLDGVDFVIVRELTGGVYFGKRQSGVDWASDECTYTTGEVERVTRVACWLAMSRRGRVASIDKANVMETSRLWRRTVDRIVRDEFPSIELDHHLVDAAAMHLITNPSQFDVILTENMFGDILSDESSVLAGSIGLLGSASLGDGGKGLFEPIHGSAPDIAGQGVANPVGMLSSVAMMLRDSLGLSSEAASLEHAISATIASGIRTRDAGGDASTEEVGRAICAALATGRHAAAMSR